MRPTRLCIEDFLSHKKSDIDFTSFNSCLIVAAHRNNPDISNGIGKSTILKAIDYVLFDVYPSVKKEEIIRDGASSCRIIFEFLLNNDLYKIERGYAKSGTFLYFYKKEADEWKDISQKTNTQTKNEILKLIKISYVAWKNSILFAQNDLEGIPFASSDKRKELLKEPLNIAIYTKYHKLAKKKLEDINQSLNVNLKLTESLGNPKEELKEIEENINLNKLNLNELKNKKETIIEKINKAKTKISDYQNMISSEAVDVSNQLLDVKSKNKEKQKDLKRTEGELDIVSSSLNSCKVNLSKKLTQLQEKIENINSIKSEDLRTLESIQNDVNFILQKEQVGKTTLAQLESKKKKAEKPIPDNGECNHCFQKIIDHKACIKRAEEELERILFDLDKTKQILKKCESKRKILEQEFNDTNKKLSKLSSLENEVLNFKSVINTDQESIIQYEKLFNIKQNDVNRLKKEIQNLTEREENLKETAKKLNINDLNSNIDSLKSEVSELEQNHINIIKEISSVDINSGALNERKKQKENNILKLNELLENKKNIEKKHSLYTKVVKAFSSNGIPSLIINTILDDLQIEVNSILFELRPNIQCQFIINNDKKDTWDIIYKIDGKERSQTLLSGGQKLFIALSFKLALSRIIQRRLGVDIRFLELDEVDQPLDKAGVEALAEIVRKWQENFLILIITHNDKLKDKFTHAIFVDGEEDGATARVVSSW